MCLLRNKEWKKFPFLEDEGKIDWGFGIEKIALGMTNLGKPSHWEIWIGRKVRKSCETIKNDKFTLTFSNNVNTYIFYLLYNLQLFSP